MTLLYTSPVFTEHLTGAHPEHPRRLTTTARFERGLTDLAQRVQPQLVLISAGFDAHREDPIGTVLEVANAYCGGRVVSLLEGGYNPLRLADSVKLHVRELLGSDSV